MTLTDNATFTEGGCRLNLSSQWDVSPVCSPPAALRAWNPCIDLLLRWREHPEEAGDEDVEPPQEPAIDRALGISTRWQRACLPAPMRTIPRGNGGLCMEWWHGGWHLVIAIQRDGGAECRYFGPDSRLLLRVDAELTRLRLHA